MLSTDASILQPGSESYGRMKDYGTLAERLDIIVCTAGEAKKELVISDTCRALPTNSRFKFGYLFDILKVAGKLVGKDVDLVTAQDPFEIGLAGWLLARRLKAKLQLQIHTDFLSPYFRKESLKNRVRVWLAKRLLPKADSIRVVSQRIRNSLSIVNCQLSKVTVLPIFIDVAKIQSALITVDLHKKYPQFDFIILMASRLEKEKNIALAIDAMREIVKKNPKAGLIIAGEGSLRQELKKRVAERALDAAVIFEGWVENASSYSKTADCVWVSSNYEGYGRGLVMTNISGTSVVTTDVGVVGEMLNADNAVVIRVGDRQALVDATLKLMADKPLRQELAKRAQQSAVSSAMTKEEYLKRYKQSWEMSL